MSAGYRGPLEALLLIRIVQNDSHAWVPGYW